MVDCFHMGLSEIDGIEIPFSSINVDSDLEQIKARTEQFMRGPNRPDGTVCASGASASSASAGIEAAGFEIERDVDLAAKQFVNILPWIRASIDAANEDVELAGLELARAKTPRLHKP